MTDFVQPPSSTIEDKVCIHDTHDYTAINNMCQEAPEYVFETVNTAEEVSTLNSALAAPLTIQHSDLFHQIDLTASTPRSFTSWYPLAMLLDSQVDYLAQLEEEM